METMRLTLVAVCLLVLAGPIRVIAAGRCAYVDVNVLMPNDPNAQCFGLDMTCGPEERYGCFKAPLTFQDGWEKTADGSKRRKLSAPFGYIDPNGVHWDVPAEFITDGASIPLLFQAFIGGPWTESHIKAAVVHDFYIRRSSVSAAAVHKMFYSALLAGGAKMERARHMYVAVAKFGPQWKNVDMAAYEGAWRARKAMIDNLNEWHKKLWEAYQESERKREQQAAIDRAVLSRPLRDRTHIFKVPERGDALATLDAFIDTAVGDHIVHPDRDATLIALLREQVEAELKRSADERNNVFVLQFTSLGATTVSFVARTEDELKTMLDLNDQVIHEQEKTADPTPLCIANCATPP